jgi:cytochrome bd-type quinol oxidase subunit 2
MVRLAASVVAGLVAVPLALAVAGVLLPGDPDDPNVKLVGLAVVVTLPSGLAAAGCYALAIRLLAHERAEKARFRALLRLLVPVAVAVLLLLIAVPVAMATPAAETAEQAAGSPYLWRSGAYRMVGSALLILTVTGWRATFSRSPVKEPNDPR